MFSTNEPMDTDKDENEEETDDVAEDRYVQFRESKLKEYFENEQRIENKFKKLKYENLKSLLAFSLVYKTPHSPSNEISNPQFPVTEYWSNEIIRTILNDATYSKFNPAVVVISIKCNETLENNERCQKEYSSENELIYHRKKIHKILKFQCFAKNCNMSFKESKNLSSHFDDHLEKEKLNIKNKNVKNIKIENINENDKINEDDKIYDEKTGVECKADKCLNIFTTLNGLNTHYKKFHQEGYFQCVKCRQCSRSHKEMDTHAKNCSVQNLNNFLDQPQSLQNSTTPKQY